MSLEIDNRTDPAGAMPCIASRNVALIGRVTQLLFTNGQTSEAMSLAVDRLTPALGSPASLFLRWGDLAIEPHQGRTWRVRAEPVAVDIRRVVAVEGVIDRLCSGSVSLAEASADLEAIRIFPPVPLARFAIMVAAGAVGLSVIIGAADPGTGALIATSAGAGAVLRKGVAHISSNPFAQPFGAALLAGLIAALSLRFKWDVSVRLVAVCPCMVLVPGPHVLNGSIDLVRARIALGTARIVFASLIVAAISAGLLLGLSVATTDLPPAGLTPSIPLVPDVVAAGVAVAAYGSFFNMPWRLLPAPIAIGMVAHAIRWVAIHDGASVPFAAFLACLVVGSVMAPLAPMFRMPFGATAFAAVVSMTPGLYLFEIASFAVDLIRQHPPVTPDRLVTLAENVATAVLVVLSMTAGLVAPKMVFDSALRARLIGPPGSKPQDTGSRVEITQPAEIRTAQVGREEG